jgi:UTP--glucose-1-phosphate uridylyltransferase
MIQDTDIYGLEIEGERYDTGDKFWFLRATVDFALAREDLWDQLRAYLEEKLRINR